MPTAKGFGQLQASNLLELVVSSGIRSASRDLLVTALERVLVGH